MQDYDEFLHELYDCSACVPPGTRGYAVQAHGRVVDGVDILLVGWNPKDPKNPRDKWVFDERPPYSEWMRRAETALETATPGFKARVNPLLPESHPLGGGRVANTRLWKWPSEGKDEATQWPQAKECAKAHLGREIRLLKPRLILTYDNTAADLLANLARAESVQIEPGPDWAKPGLIRGWANPGDIWGSRLALLLIGGNQSKGLREGQWIRAKAKELLMM